MKHLIKTSIITTGLTLTVLMAETCQSHGGHNHGHGHDHAKKEISQSSVQTRAKAYLLQLIKDKKLDKSWADINSTQVKKEELGDNKEWIVNFNNTKIKEKQKQKLYIFLSLYGKIIGSTYASK